LQQLSLSLLEPDFTTAARVARAINEALSQNLATAVDNATIQVNIPPAARENVTPFIVTLESLSVEPDTAARVVINERTGTVVIGQRVRLMPVAICHGGLTVEIRSQTQVSQPPPLISGGAGSGVAVEVGPSGAPPATEQKPRARVEPAPPVQDVRPGTVPSSREHPGGSLTGGRTVVVRQEELNVQEKGGSLATIPEQATLEDLVAALNALGVKPRDLIAIIQALKEAHALRAELVLF
jgi:flagellar P-ring protein precursor FlgI